MRKTKSHTTYQLIGRAVDDGPGNDGAHFVLQSDICDRRQKRLYLLLFANIGILFTSLCVLVGAWRLVPSELDSAKRVSPFCEKIN